MEEEESWGTFPNLKHFGGRGHVGVLGWD